MSATISYDQLFSTSYEQIQAARERENLANDMPVGYTTLEELDQECLELANQGRLVIVDNPEIRQLMADIKNPDISRAEFQSMSMRLIGHLMTNASSNLKEEELPISLAVSVRGGLPIYASALQHFPGIEHGFSEQRRDETTLLPTSHSGKLSNYSDRHTLVVDFMLATGGSLVHLVDLAVANGASELTTVTAFSTPQGIVRASKFEGIKTMISLPLEAGLNYLDKEHHGFIVGGHSPNSMLGDFGDRFHGHTYTPS